ncbi:hypothetical protein [Gaiella sp.]|uniref:prealbumin-like fold domain-containing protein n=1 Tax=Gaiella sp. TaxID=2663207 RepID=UPI003266BA8A
MTQYGWKWDEVDLSGKNTQDVCVYLSSTTSGASDPNAAEYAVCYSLLQVNPTDTPVATITYWSCPTYATANASTGGQKCFGNSTETLPAGVTLSATAALTTDVLPQFSTDPDNDTQVILDVTSNLNLTLINICSKKSSSPASDSSDCGIERAPAFLKLVKVVQGGPALPSEWTLSWDGPGTNDGSVTGDNTQFVPVLEGVYTLSESTVSGYGFFSLVCAPNASTGSTATGSSVTLASGDQVTCTYTNTPIAPTLTVNKVCVPTNDGGLFNLRIDAATAGTGANAACGGTTGAVQSTLGPHTVSETAGTNTSLANYDTVIGGACAANGTITLVAGQNAVCTITNTLKAAPQLTVEKVCPSGKAATTDRFQPRNGGSDFGAALDCGGSSTNALTPDTAYAITEVGAGTPAANLANYTTTYSAACVNAQGLARGAATPTCTITNQLNPKLTVIKMVVGGTKTAADFSMTVKRGDEALASFPGSDGLGTTRTYTPGNYAVGEVVDPLYSVTYGEGCSGTLAYGDDKTCTVTNTRKARSITVEKTVSATPEGEYVQAPDKATNPENGGTFYFKVVITNDSVADTITVTDLTDIIEPDETVDAENLDNLVCGTPDQGDGIPFTLAPDASITCTFSRDLIGNAGATETDHVDVSWKDEEGTTQEPESSNDAIIELTDVPSKLQVVKTANPTSVQEGTRAIAFTITITNLAQFTLGEATVNAVDNITVTSLQDDKLGDLDAAGDVTCTVGGATKTWPITITPGQSIVCTVTRNITGTPSSPHVNTATATGTDDDGNTKTASDDATVTFTATPPPPYVPSSDVTVTKSATAAVQLPLGGGSVPIVYTIAARNNGPDAAQNVLVSDSAPVDVTFVSATTGKGTCTTTAKAVDCTISSLAAGESVPISINATVNATGTKTNVVIVSNKTPIDNNPNNNTAQASTLVTAPLTPPKPPVVVPEICSTLVANPKVLKATGKAQKISITVKKGKKGVKGATVKITGPGISKTAKTGKNGKVIVTVKPSQPGIIRVAIQGAKACNTQRIGVVGVYEPPVTG